MYKVLRGCPVIDKSFKTTLPYIILILLYTLLAVLRDTSVTPYTRPPISTDLATRDRLRDCRNLRQSTAICRSPPYSTEFYYNYNLKPILPRIRIN